jgi:hypothetical protein
MEPPATAIAPPSSKTASPIAIVEAKMASASLAGAKPAAPGLFLMKISESRDLINPSGQKVQPGGASGKQEDELPFAVIEMDKNEVLMRAVEGNPATGNGIWGTRAHLYHIS